MGDFPGAGVAFRHALSLDPGMAKAHYGLALTLIGNALETQTGGEQSQSAAMHSSFSRICLMDVGLTKQAQDAAAIEALQHATQLTPAFADPFQPLLALEAIDRLGDAERNIAQRQKQ